MASPFRFLIRFFSSFLQAYILPVARTWQAHTYSQGTGQTGTSCALAGGTATQRRVRGWSSHPSPTPVPTMHSAEVSGLATHLPKATFAQDSVLPEGVFGHWLPVGKGLGSK